MLRALIKKQLMELFQTYFVDKKTGKAKSNASTVGAFVLFGVLSVVLGFSFFSMSYGIGSVVLGGDANWLYFALTGLLSIALGVFGSAFNTYASVYLPKDNETLLAMPIPPRTILLARTSGVFITSLMYSAWIWVPSMIAYWVIVPVTVLNVVFPILLTLVLALFVSVLSCVLGFFVALIAARAKGKSFLIVFLSLAFIVGYYIVYFRIINSINEIIERLDTIGNTVRSWLHYAWLLGTAADGSVWAMLAVTGITLALAAVCLFVLSKTFMKIALTKGNAEGKTARVSGYTARGTRKALLLREYKHFSSLPTWMLNGGLGLLLIPVAAIAALIKSAALREVLTAMGESLPDVSITDALPAVTVAAACMLLSMDCISTVSVSLEGNTLWLLQSLPIDPWEVLRAKARMAIQLNILPALVFSICLGIAFRLSVLLTALTTLAVLAFIPLLVDFGLMLNLRKPDLKWSNPAVVTKQSMPVLINLFGGWAFAGIVGIVGFGLSQLIGGALSLVCILVLFVGLWLVLHLWLKRRGTRILSEL